MPDDYAVTAEFADLVQAARPDDDLLPALRAALASLPIDTTLPVVDLGAGTGLGTVAIAEALPDAAVFAVEMSRAMRTVLLSRLAARPDLRQRVTVVPGDLFSADLPHRWGAAVGVHLVCQLPPERRRSLWTLFADRLAHDAPAILDRHYGADRREAFEEQMTGSIAVGEHEYQRWFAREPAGKDSFRISTRFRVLRDGAVVDEQVTTSTVWAAQEADALAESAAAGLVATPIDDKFVALRRG